MYCVANNNKSQTLAQHLSVYHSEFFTENEFLKKSQKRNQISIEKQNKCIYKLNKMQIVGQYMYTGYNIVIKTVLIFSIRGEFVF